MDYAVWKDAKGDDHVTYFIAGLSEEKKTEALATLVTDGHMPVNATVNMNGTLPTDKSVVATLTQEERLRALELAVFHK